MYSNIYSLFMQYVYGGSTITPDMELVCTLFSTTACLFCVSLPFIVVWRFIKAVCG